MILAMIAIIGARELGCRIAYAAARTGLRVILEDISPENVELGAARIARALDEDDARGDCNTAERELTLSRITTANSVEEACREADLILETVPDEEEMKLELFTIFDKFARPGAILASTAKAVSIDDLADMTFCADRCVGMRFSGGTVGEEKIELVRGRATSDETVRRCREFGRRMGMEVTVLEDEKTISAGAGN